MRHGHRLPLVICFLFPNTLEILDFLLFEYALALLGVVHTLADAESTEGSAVVSLGSSSCAGGPLTDYPLL